MTNFETRIGSPAPIGESVLHGTQDERVRRLAGALDEANRRALLYGERMHEGVERYLRANQGTLADVGYIGLLDEILPADESDQTKA